MHLLLQRIKENNWTSLTEVSGYCWNASKHFYTHTHAHTHTHAQDPAPISIRKAQQEDRDKQTLLKKQSFGVTVLECLGRSWACLDLSPCGQDFWSTCCKHLADTWQLEKVATFIFSQPPVILLHWSPKELRNLQKALREPLIFLPCSWTPMGTTADSKRHSKKIKSNHPISLMCILHSKHLPFQLD